MGNSRTETVATRLATPITSAATPRPLRGRDGRATEPGGGAGDGCSVVKRHPPFRYERVLDSTPHVGRAATERAS